mmetsp:Transcript_6054/g.11477  ORF Transcript_6054/g.11477 Transcript_6054/m.11477 type:complete len:1004 (-) Transcript_6054:21-3032(-)|eukprot:CAMPEP_0176503316 /NCGR_PEP_ID=MMETSP0200_2-20121128/15293_1 /TAXON_ID=947934 /ORGANISM="Chaetoceros sp., Strain GSL56" /LENGTH=1003 /DNA_ID=CAMNT_0017902589 /DNA_START=348 /DNA_END=3359 /DNA_ORIENTATION=+
MMDESNPTPSRRKSHLRDESFSSVSTLASNINIEKKTNDDPIAVGSSRTPDSETFMMKQKSSSPGCQGIASPSKIETNLSTSLGTPRTTMQSHAHSPKQQQKKQTIGTATVGSKAEVARRSSTQSSAHSLTLSEGSIDEIDRLDRSDRSMTLISRKLQSFSTSCRNVKLNNANTHDQNISMASVKYVALAPESTAKVLSCLQDKPKVPLMKDPSNCNLFCSFYAEFDNVVGPKVSYQAPKYFMDHDIAITTAEIEQLLAQSFKTITSSQLTTCQGGTKGKNRNQDSEKVGNDSQSRGVVTNEDIPPSKSSSSGPNDNTQTKRSDEAEAPTVPHNSQSIFDSTCEYIITGKELSGQIISLSTHNMHIIARPTVIEDERYERNSLLFSVGFVIRRKADPTPYRPMLSRFASTLRSMEIESRFLSSSSTKHRIEQFLNVIVPSLNSKSAKCHLLLDEANALHIQYFPPPKVYAPIVPEYAVPVLLRPEYMLQSLDWDLTINWIVPHINGIKHAKLIAESSKVDEAMVLSCLRVLRHHNVLACVDIFRYSNVYESTVRAQKMLAGDMPGLLNQAFQFVAKHSYNQQSSPTNISVAPEGTSMGSLGPSTCSPRYSKVGNHGGGNDKPSSTVTLLAPLGAPASYPPVKPTLLDPMGSMDPGDANASSYTSGRPIYMVKTSSPPTAKGGTTAEPIHPLESLQSTTPISFSLHAQHTRAYDQKEPTSMMTALAILYASCQRNMTLSDVLTNRVQENDSDSVGDVPASINRQSKAKKTKNRRSKLRSASLASSGTSTCSDALGGIDWKEVFNYFDHRRFATFGIIHGLIRRVHEYPIVVRTESKEERTAPTEERTAAEYKPMGRKLQINAHDDSPYQFTSLRRHKSMGAVLSSGSQCRTPPLQSLLYPQNFSPSLTFDSQEESLKESFVPIKNHDGLGKGISSTHSLSSVVTAKSSHATGTLAKKIASAMDGSHCDDELCCMFQKSMEEMKKLVRNYTGNEIISVYSSPEEK